MQRKLKQEVTKSPILINASENLLESPLVVTDWGLGGLFSYNPYNLSRM